MTSSIANQITNMQNQTALNKTTSERKANTENDSNMFLTLMLQQLQNQDPTQPTDNTQWLSQLAQYSSLEQMTQMNTGLKDCMDYVSALYSEMTTSSEISQTLSMIGKEVIINVPDEKDPTKFAEVSGTVQEANFKDGTGKIKVNNEYYSIANVISVKNEINSKNN